MKDLKREQYKYNPHENSTYAKIILTTVER